MPDAHRVLEICGEGRTRHRERGLADEVRGRSLSRPQKGLCRYYCISYVVSQPR